MGVGDESVRFIMMVGIPASGKSTKAQDLAKKTGALIISSDDLRHELFEDVNCQDRNTELFQEMNRRTIKFLKMGESVIYDATNLSSKRRKALLTQIPKGVFKCCIYMVATPYQAEIRDIDRDRVVGSDVIDKMYKRAQVPMYHEGWDSIILYPLHHRFDNKKEFVMPDTYEEYRHFLIENDCRGCVDLAQDTPYHTLSVSRHMYYAYDKIKDSDNEDVKIACLLHDIGKWYCKEFNGKYASFKCHECVSAQMAIRVLKEFDLSEKRIIRIATLIQLHMMMHNKEWGSKSRERFKNEVGVDMWNDLMTLNNCDSTAK